MRLHRPTKWYIVLFAMLTLGMTATAHGGDEYGWDCHRGGHMMGGYGGHMMGGYGGHMMGGYGGYMMGGYGMGAGMMMGRGWGPMAALDLSDEQRKKIFEISEETRKQHWQTMGKMMDERAKMSELYSKDKPDPDEVGAAYSRIAKLRREMVEAHVRASNRMHDVLTDEQREQLRQWHRRGYRHGPRSERREHRRGGGMGMMGP